MSKAAYGETQLKNEAAILVRGIVDGKGSQEVRDGTA
jgi:hypothetical protein